MGYKLVTSSIASVPPIAHFPIPFRLIPPLSRSITLALYFAPRKLLLQMPCDRSSVRKTKPRSSRRRTATPEDDDHVNPPELYYGYIESLLDVFLIIEASSFSSDEPSESKSLGSLFQAGHRGLVPRVVEKPTDPEKKLMVRSGAVVLHEQTESNFLRWNDPLVSSATEMCVAYAADDARPCNVAMVRNARTGCLPRLPTGL